MYKIISRKKQATTNSPLHFSELPLEDKRKEIFKRALESCPYKVGDRVKIRNTSKEGVIVDVEDNFDLVQWNNLNPLFIYVNVEGTVYVSRPSILRYKNGKI